MKDLVIMPLNTLADEKIVQIIRIVIMDTQTTLLLLKQKFF